MRNIFKRKKRVLIYGDYNCTTGFSSVTTNILRQLRKKFAGDVQFDIIAINWYGDLLPGDYNILPEEAADIKEVDQMIDGKVKKVKKRIRELQGQDVVVYSAFYHDGKEDVFGRNGMLSMLNAFEYSLVFMIQDLGVVSPILEVIRKIKNDKKARKNTRVFKVMYYFPLDGSMIPSWFDNFDVIDRVIAYTEYAKSEVLKVRPDLKMSVILHGVDTGDFGPLDPEYVEEFRRSFFGENSSKTIITNINRNQHRKDIPTTIFAFEEYLRIYNPNAFLYLHMNPEDFHGWNLKVVMEQTTLKNNVDYMFTPPSMIENPPEPGFINCIYNASDRYLTTTTGEGFGLTILEAMMAKTLVIAPLHTSIPELSGDGKWIYSFLSTRKYVSRFDNMIRLSACPVHVAEVIHQSFTHPSYATDGKIYEAHAFASSLSWKEIGLKWVDEFKKLL